MKVLVIGATGALGHPVVKALLERGGRYVPSTATPHRLAISPASAPRWRPGI